MITIFPEWAIRLTEECERQKADIYQDLLTAIRANAFAHRSSIAVEQPEQDFEDFESLIQRIDQVQEQGKDPRTTLKKHKTFGRSFYFYYLQAGHYYCFFRRDPVRRVATGLFIQRIDDNRRLSIVRRTVRLWP